MLYMIRFVSHREAATPYHTEHYDMFRWTRNCYGVVLLRFSCFE